MNSRLNLKCQGCGTVGTFVDEKAAFQAGWDFPPLSPVTTCGRCPSAPLMLERDETVSEESDSNERTERP